MTDNFKHELENFVEISKTYIKNITTEEATKNSLILPFFEVLGYDTRNPAEFTPEYTADVFDSKKEKVDYAIIINKKPVILIECKPCNTQINNSAKFTKQLYKYFSTTVSAKIAILTNGIDYRFYTDFENTNMMDPDPFLVIDIFNLTDRDIAELKKFSRSRFNMNKILDSASQLMYSWKIRTWLDKEFNSPSADFVRYILKEIDSNGGKKSAKVVAEFTPLIKKIINEYVKDLASEKVKTAFDDPDPGDDGNDSGNKPDDPDNNGSANGDGGLGTGNVSRPEERKSKIITTEEEIEAYAIIKSILAQVVDRPGRIVYRDAESYFSVLLDNSNRKWIIRLHFLQRAKYITIADGSTNGIRHDINKIDDIYKFSNEIIESYKRYLSNQ